MRSFASSPPLSRGHTQSKGHHQDDVGYINMTRQTEAEEARRADEAGGGSSGGGKAGDGEMLYNSSLTFVSHNILAFFVSALWVQRAFVIVPLSFLQIGENCNTGIPPYLFLFYFYFIWGVVQLLHIEAKCNLQQQGSELDFNSYLYCPVLDTVSLKISEQFSLQNFVLK